MSDTEPTDETHTRCQGCGELVRNEKMNRPKATANRSVRYCDRCEKLREIYDVSIEQHDQYQLPDLCDEIAEADR